MVLTRVGLLRKRNTLTPRFRPAWRLLLLINIVAASAAWGAFAAYTIARYGVGHPNVTFMMMISAAVAGAGVHLMVHNAYWAAGYSFSILGPPAVICAAAGGSSVSFALCLIYYFFYLLGQSRRFTRTFWSSIEDTVELGRLAHQDALTGLANRLALERTVQSALTNRDRFGQRVCLFYIDLDGFKQVNDRYTHRIGDLLLAEIAARLRASVDNRGTVCRLGGDEFCVFLTGALSEHEAQQLADKILTEVRRPACIDGALIHPSASIGISFHNATDIDLADLLRTADQAMYLAKAVKGGGIRSAAELTCV